MKQIRQLFDYHVWANEKWFTHLEQLPADVYDNTIQSVFPSISQTIAHIHLFDRLWLSVLAEKPNSEIFSMFDTWTREAQNKSVTDIRVLFADTAEQYRALLQRTPADKEMTIEHPQYGRMDTRFSEIVQHVVNHGTYHRGNMTAMLRQQGHPGIGTDFIFYLKDIRNQA